MTDNESAVLLRHRSEGIAEVVLNRPDKRNAFDDVIDDTAHRIADIRVGEEGQEGLSAFLNKRKANWVPETD